MTKKLSIQQLVMVLLLCLLQTAGFAIYGQDRPRAASRRIHRQTNDTILKADQQLLRTDSIGRIPASKIAVQADALANDSIARADSIAAENRRKMLEMTGSPSLKSEPLATDSLQQAIPSQRWVPNPTKATWLALIIPGGGQIYNRKYWKLPIVYGGFAGCAYALTWNNKMYKDYFNAYKDAVNKRWDSSNILDLLPPGYIDRVSKSQLTETLRKRKDTYRRYRDMSIFAFIGVYLLSVVDAYVDAELSNFDISPDLSMRVEPTVINNNKMTGSSKNSVGVQCSFRF